MDIKRVVRALVIAALLSVLLYAALAALTDASNVVGSLRTFPLQYLAGAVALALLCYLLRAARWWYLVRVVGHPMGALDAVYTQLSGMTMTVTPGKVGEVLKAYLGRELAGLPMTKGISIVFSERLTDVIAVIALSVGALGAFRAGTWPLVGAAIVVGAGTLVLASERFHRVVLRAISGRQWMKQHHASARSISETVRVTMSLRHLVVSVALAVIAWGSEGVAFWLVLEGLGFRGLSVGVAVGVYAISTLLGALSFSPGGIGLTEASMAGLLVALATPGSTATAAVLIIRVVTMWFGVGLGWLTLLSRPALVKKLAGAQDAEDG